MDMHPLGQYADEEMVIADNGTGVELEDTSVGEQIIKPFDPFLMRVDTKPMVIDRLCLRIGSNELELTPDFERKGGIWKEETQSRLIESMLIRLPLPAFYLDATNNKKWLVVDGLQRLITLTVIRL